MKTVLITGAASGIGLDLTKQLLESGYRVWAGARKPELLKKLQRRFKKNLIPVQLDVTSAKDINAVFNAIRKEKLTDEFILINNAGIAIAGPLESIPVVEWEKVYAVNVFGLVRVTQTFLPILRETKGRIINVGSISGRLATPFFSVYSSSKFSVRAISDSLRRELARHGVQVVLVEPGPIKTPIWQKSLAQSQNVRVKLSPDLEPIYGKALKALANRVTSIEKTAAPVEHVTEKVLHAISQPRSEPYYLIGRFIGLQALAARYIPTTLIDRVLQ